MGIMAVSEIIALLLVFIYGGDAAQVCYGELGCFTDEGCHALSYPPEHPAFIKTRFFLYTRRNMNTFQELIREDVLGLRASNFDPKKKTKFSIHGWNGNSDGSSEVDRRKAFLETEDVNVIMVDWRRGASGINYPKQHQNTRVVGREIGLMARFLNLETGMYYKDVHLVGHSLGSHVAGFAGEFQQGFGRITGTDPAGPGFRYDGPECRLDPTDALFVDIIHTDGNELIGLGTMLVMGHQDFYPNGGRNQPGCNKGGGDIGGCSHGYSNYYFVESVRSTTCKFTAYPCAGFVDYLNGACDDCGDGCSEMGYHSSDHSHLRGTFFLDTNNESPYCIQGPGL